MLTQWRRQHKTPFPESGICFLKQTQPRISLPRMSRSKRGQRLTSPASSSTSPNIRSLFLFVCSLVILLACVLAYVCVFTFVCVCVYMYECMYVCVCVCVCVCAYLLSNLLVVYYGCVLILSYYLSFSFAFASLSTNCLLYCLCLFVW